MCLILKLEQGLSVQAPSLCVPRSVNKKIKLGPNLRNGQKLQAVIPKSIWQSAQSTGEWSLVSCVVAPAFTFNGFEMAKKGWEPKDE